MTRWLPDSFDPLAHNARVRSQRSDMRAADAAHRIVGTDSYAGAVAVPPPSAGPRTSSARPASAAPAPYPLVALCRADRVPEPVPEYRFHPHRRWRFDYAWPIYRVAVEIEGGVWTQGRHTRGAGYLADLAKYNSAALLGWLVLRYTPDQLPQALDDLRIALARIS